MAAIFGRAGMAALCCASIWTAAARGGSDIVQLPGTAGCITETGSGGECADAKALDGLFGLAVSPDGRHVYTTAITPDAVAFFLRDPITGALTPVSTGDTGCIANDSTDCLDAHALLDPAGIAVSPDGLHVYVALLESDGVAVFDRSVVSGILLQKDGTQGCITETGSGGECVEGRALLDAFAIAVSPDGRNVYVGSGGSDAVAVFDRNAETGVLTQKALTDGCVSESGHFGFCADVRKIEDPTGIALSPDGRNLYVASSDSAAVAVFERDLLTGALTQLAGEAGCVAETGEVGVCVDGTALTGPARVAVSQDGAHVYVSTTVSDSVAALNRIPASGSLTPVVGAGSCVSQTGTGGACAVVDEIDLASDLVVSPDGRALYLISFQSSAVSVFDRDPDTGALTPETGLASCVNSAGTSGCLAARAIANPTAMALSPDGRNLYVGGITDDGVAVFARDLPAFDIDGDGASSPLTDGLLLVRHRFGFTGATLVTGAVNLAGCTRCTAAAIEAFIEGVLE